MFFSISFELKNLTKKTTGHIALLTAITFGCCANEMIKVRIFLHIWNVWSESKFFDWNMKEKYYFINLLMVFMNRLVIYFIYFLH